MTEVVNEGFVVAKRSSDTGSHKPLSIRYKANKYLFKQWLNLPLALSQLEGGVAFGPGDGISLKDVCISANRTSNPSVLI